MAILPRRIREFSFNKKKALRNLIPECFYFFNKIIRYCNLLPNPHLGFTVTEIYDEISPWELTEAI